MYITIKFDLLWHLFIINYSMIRIITKRENEIFQLLVDGYTTDDISNLLNISKKTVRNHISNVIQKLGVSNRNQAILELLKMKIVLLKNPY